MDKNIILWFYKNFYNNEFILKFFSFITHLGDAGFIWIIIAIALLLKNNTRKKGAIMLLSLFVGAIIGNVILKNIFQRERPFLALNLQPFIDAPSSFSFPSGHSLASFVGATCIFYINKKWGILAYILAFLIALSRVVLTVHYPTDVITGAILGFVVASVIILIAKKYDRIKTNN